MNRFINMKIYNKDMELYSYRLQKGASYESLNIK
jgi:hypothetical protein